MFFFLLTFLEYSIFSSVIVKTKIKKIIWKKKNMCIWYIFTLSQKKNSKLFCFIICLKKYVILCLQYTIINISKSVIWKTIHGQENEKVILIVKRSEICMISCNLFYQREFVLITTYTNFSQTYPLSVHWPSFAILQESFVKYF